MYVSILNKKVKLLEILAEGCHTHPAYRAKRSATGNCTDCVVVWTARQQLKELNDDKSLAYYQSFQATCTRP